MRRPVPSAAGYPRRLTSLPLLLLVANGPSVAGRHAVAVVDNLGVDVARPVNFDLERIAAESLLVAKAVHRLCASRRRRSMHGPSHVMHDMRNMYTMCA